MGTLATLGSEKHCCLLFRTRSELAEVVAPFLSAGLEQGDRAVVLGSGEFLQGLREDLPGVGLPVDDRSEKRKVLFEGGSTSTSTERSPPDQIGFLQALYSQALRSGFAGLRIVADSSWLHGVHREIDELVSTEALLEVFVAAKRIAVLCTYSRDTAPPDLLLGALQAHRHVVIDGQPCANPFQQPAELLLEPDVSGKARARVEWITGQLLRARRAEQEQAREMAELASRMDQAERAVRERRELEEQLHHALRMEAIGRLTSGVAHDFNNLLTVIYGNCEIALEHPAARVPDLRSVLGEIHGAAQRAAVLTGQLLRFSRKEESQPEVLNLNRAIATTDQLLRRILGEDIRIVTQLEEVLDSVLFDSGQLEQILMSLAVNARDAMPQGGTLTIETANAPPHVLLAVSDTGIGMDSDTQARALEPFFTTKGPASGTGLGLSTVDEMVRRAGGHIQVESAVGRGSRFTVYLPRTDPAGAGRPKVGSGGVYKML
jgi:signal transduction histidine kinase